MSATIDPPRMVHEDQLTRLMKLGAERERDAIVAWLRGLAGGEDSATDVFVHGCADAIERGEHEPSSDPA